MYTDSPLIKTKDDKLGRSLFATEIALGLVNSFKENKESIVIGINGDWGTGKSTLVNFILEEVKRITLEKNEEVIILQFNPWMFSGQKELQNIFLKQLFLKLQSNKEKFRNASEKIIDFLKYLTWIKYFHTGANEAIEDIKDVLGQFNSEKDINELKSEIDELLIKSGVKLYITIDDIDRLTPKEITDVFQLVKLNANFANTIFILAYDQDVVTSALDHQFGQNGRKYIEKIVQIDYTLPPVSKENIICIFQNSLNQLFEKMEILDYLNDNQEILEKQFISFFKSLRDIYRYINSIKLRLSSIYTDLNIIDFLQVESLRIFNSDAYRFILDNKDNLIFREQDSIRLQREMIDNNSPANTIKHSDFDKRTKEILHDLFSFNSPMVSNFSSEDELIRKKRVANEYYFDRYFNLQLASFEIKETKFDSFIEESLIDNKVQILKEIQKEGKLFHFLKWVKIKCQYSNYDVMKKILESYLFFSESLRYKKDSFFSFYDSEFKMLLWALSDLLKEVNEIENRREIIISYIANNKKGYSFSKVYISNSIFRAKEKKDKNELLFNYMWYELFSENNENNNIFIGQVEAVEKAASKFLFEQIFKEGKFNEDELTFIFPLAAFHHSKIYDRDFNKLIENDKSLIGFIWLCIRRSYMVGNGKSGYQLAKYQFFPGMNINTIKKRIEKINIKDFDKNEQKIIRFFKKASSDGFKDKKFYDLETLDELK